MKEKIENAFIQPITGIPLILLILFAIFLFIGKFMAQTVVDFTQGILFGTWYFNLIMGFGVHFIDPDSLLGCLLIGEYGLFTMIPIYLFGLLLPLVFSFYLVMIILEDSALFHRIAALAEKALQLIGLSGQSAIPLILGFGCVTAALISTSSLSSRREKLITSVLLCIAVPCSAQLTILMVVASSLKAYYFLIYLGVVLSIFFSTGLLLNLFLPGETERVFLKIPPLTCPSLSRAIRKAIKQSGEFVMDATPTFILGGVLMAVLNYTNSFLRIHDFFSPITTGLLHLPAEATDLFVLAIIKKDLGAAGLYSIIARDIMTQPQITVMLVVMTLFVPCFASVLVFFKEWGPFLTILVWIGSFVIAFAVGGAVSMFFP